MEYHNKHPIRLLALEHSPNDVERWVQLFRHTGFPLRVEYIASLEMLEQALKRQEWDAVISVEETPTFNAHQILRTFRHKNLDIPVIVTLNQYQPNIVSKWLDAGARDAIPANSEKHILHAVVRECSSLEGRRSLQSEQRKLIEANKRCQLLLNNAPEAIAYMHYGMHVDANQAYIELLGYDKADDLAGLSLIDLVTGKSKDAIKQKLTQFQQGKSSPPFECQLSHNDGQIISASIQLSEARYDDEPCIQVTIHPAIIPTLHQPLHEQSPLTPRDHMFQKAEELLKKASRTTLIWLQIDDYDSVRKSTDINGVLSIQHSISKLIREHLPETMSCHYGDDVFLILDTIMNEDKVSEKLSQLQSLIGNHLFGSDHETLTVSTSIGFATQQDSNDLNSLISFAQTAYDLCQQDKDSHIKQYSRTEEVRLKALDGDIQARIEQALSDETFQISFQPVINVTGTGEKQHYETMIHIPTTGKETINIHRCMDAGELSTLMPLVDRWTLRQSVLELTKKQKKGEIPRLIIPLSQWSIQDPKLVSYLSNLLKASRIPADSIILQLQESVALQQLKGVVELEKDIQKIGCLLSIDDFQGTSSALRLLQHLNLYLVQLDAQFTKTLGKKHTKQLEDILNTLGDNNTHCVATNIINSQTIAHLWQLGIEFAKGDYISHPSNTMDYDFE
ncbi:hypothetical protein ACH42_10525 [Endozoicomonas sp. (ex Bugula neritina AB1)]|nr:hypothetical protein ACH42_10525 [Endozoicomonas sp. (ex Bugula neritina AB1)]